MNKRIQELAEQAGSTHKPSLGVYQFYGFELERFAELIIKECANVASDAQEGAHPWHYGRLIQEHFGVE